MKIKVVSEESVFEITPQILAEAFAQMDSKEQAQFFNTLGEITSNWYLEGGSLMMQLQYLTDEDGLTLAGRRVMQGIGDYSHWGLVPNARD